MNQEEKILNVSIDLLVPNSYQPRKIFNEESLKELASSIKEYGILNPILVRKKDDKYEIIAGERRYRAAKMIGKTEVPVIIKDIADTKMAELALIENLQRENISPIEEAKSYKEILNRSNITEQKLSEMIGKSQSFISNKLRLLNLPENIQNALAERKISERHARSLMTVDDKEKQTELLQMIMKEKLTVKELDNIINDKKTTEEEIKLAIDDIMQSLNINEEKEKKESDNMNNGNFFPNYNNQPQNNEMSLNSMNMQTMEQNSQPSPVDAFQTQPPVETQISNMTIPTMDFGNMNSPIKEPEPIQEMNQQIDQIPINTFSPAPSPVPELNPIPPVINEPPLFGEPNTPVPTQNEPVQNEIASFQYQEEPAPLPQQTYVEPPVLQDPPLFNSELTIPTNNAVPAPSEEPSLNESFYEVPVNISPVIEEPTPEVNKLTQVEQLLSSNGIEYKAYSNETGHCIIIEL